MKSHSPDGPFQGIGPPTGAPVVHSLAFHPRTHPALRGSDAIARPSIKQTTALFGRLPHFRRDSRLRVLNSFHWRGWPCHCSLPGWALPMLMVATMLMHLGRHSAPRQKHRWSEPFQDLSGFAGKVNVPFKGSPCHVPCLHGID